MSLTGSAGMYASTPTGTRQYVAATATPIAPKVFARPFAGRDRLREPWRRVDGSVPEGWSDSRWEPRPFIAPDVGPLLPRVLDSRVFGDL